ncbi:MAG: sulfotransferase [Luteolibacter sp.]
MENPEPEELAEARALWAHDRYEEALEKFEAALARTPDHPIALIDTARAYGSCYRMARASALVSHFLDVCGRTPRTLALAGQTYRMIQRPNEALACLREAVSSSPDDLSATLELALLLDRAGKTGEAEAMLARLLERAPSFAEGRFLRAQLLVRLKRTDEALPVLQAIAQDERQHRYLRTRARYALAEAADQEGDVEKAMQEAAAAKALGEMDAAPMRRIAALIRQQGDQLLEKFSRASLQQWKLEGTDTPPTTLLTGHPRSGTTLLEKALAGHPGLVSSDEHDLFARLIAPPVLQPRGKEGTGHAGKRLLAVDRRRASAMRRSYLRGIGELLDRPLEGRLLVDKNPSLTELIPAWLRMLPDSRILVALRDPRDVVLSCYLNYLPLNAYSVSFLTLEDTARRYVREMETWLRLREILSPEQWREVRYEDSVEDLPGTLHVVLEWMGLPWTDEVLNYRDSLERNPTRSPTYAAVTQPVHRGALARWRRYQAWIEPVMPVLAPVMERLGFPS